MASNVRITDGSWDWSGGVDSGKVTTVASDLVQNGLGRNQLAWLTNATVRGGGIVQRTGWKPLCTVHPGGALYQGGILYDNSLQSGDPYLMLSVGGTLYRVRVDTDNSVTDISTPVGLSDPASTLQAYFVQAEEFMVKQAGDGVTLPLIWDGNTLRRSVGLGGAPTRELPAATAMDYYMGRIWYAQDRQYTAGDIVLGPSGTAPYQQRDSVLKVTENPLALAGDGFIVPSNAGLIRGLKHSANLDTALGQGQLFVYTRKSIYSLDVPTTRADWIASMEPLQKVAHNRNGAYGQRCIVNVNADQFFQSSDGIRSLFLAIRDFSMWGNVPISRNINRLLNFNDRALMSLASGIYFDNRMIQSSLPVLTDVGIAYQGLAILDFDTISSLESRQPPAWEGIWQGVDILELFEGDFGGLQRAFAVVHSRDDGSIQVWELTLSERTDKNDARVGWQIETPAYTWNEERELKQLDGGEIWVDRVYGTVDMTVYYRPDAETCWQLWSITSFCSAKSTCEDVENPVCYPEQPYGENFKFPITLPTPPAPDCQSLNRRPLTIGYQFQVKIVIKGWCRVRGIMLHALPRQKEPFGGMIC